VSSPTEKRTGLSECRRGLDFENEISARAFFSFQPLAQPQQQQKINFKKINSKSPLPLALVSPKELPAEHDWRKGPAALTPVRNQVRR